MSQRLIGVPPPQTEDEFFLAADAGVSSFRTVFDGVDFGALTRKELSKVGEKRLQRAIDAGDLEDKESFHLLELLDAGLDTKKILDREARKTAIQRGLADRRGPEFKSRSALAGRLGDVTPEAIAARDAEKEALEEQRALERGIVREGLRGTQMGLDILTGDFESPFVEAFARNQALRIRDALAARGAAGTPLSAIREDEGVQAALQSLGGNILAGGLTAATGAQQVNPFLNPGFTSELEATTFQQRLNDFALRFQINQAHRARSRASPTNQFLSALRTFGTEELTGLLGDITGLIRAPIQGVASGIGGSAATASSDFFQPGGQNQNPFQQHTGANAPRRPRVGA